MRFIGGISTVPGAIPAEGQLASGYILEVPIVRYSHIATIKDTHYKNSGVGAIGVRSYASEGVDSR